MHMMMLSRYATLQLVLWTTIACVLLGYLVSAYWYFGLIVLGPLALVGIHDLIQKPRAILRNYPIIGHLRFLLEHIRPEIRQYIIEDDRDPVPFSREQRNLVYRRAKNVQDVHPFGTVANVGGPGYGWIDHSMQPLHLTYHDFRVTIGGKDCKQPYEASILNISGTSFGAVSANAIMALNWGAKLGEFAHNTGEGSISPYHRKYGGDLIWQIATGYFGARTADGRLDPEKFAKQAADPQVKMIEVKLSQGAKPGHGGVLPKAKISAEIAATRGIEMGRDCISPPSHPEFSTPLEYCAFIGRLRELSGGKPVGTKLAIGQKHEFMALVKAMLKTGIKPDFIVVDGGEGGTGAAPMELSDHMGAPLVEALSFVRNVLVGAGLRDDIKIGASGKIVSAYDMVRTFALGADFVMAARGFMFAVGCIQSRSCHSNKCPTGVATQDKSRQSALVVEDKAPRVASFHKNTLRALAEVLGAAGVTHPQDLTPDHLHIRHQNGAVIRGDEAYPPLAEESLLRGKARPDLQIEWDMAQAETFAPKRRRAA